MSAAILNREELDKLERRELQLTILSVVFVLILAGGLAAFMYPLVFVHPDGNKWTLRVAFFGFCVPTRRNDTFAVAWPGITVLAPSPV